MPLNILFMLVACFIASVFSGSLMHSWFWNNIERGDRVDEFVVYAYNICLSCDIGDGFSLLSR